MDLIALQTEIHRQNIEKGWWDTFRSFSTLTNLNISEVSEAVEADRKKLMDDKLVKYAGVPVEAADGCIRAFDVLASLENDNYDCSELANEMIKSRDGQLDFLLAYASWCFSKSWGAFEFTKSQIETKQYLVDAIHTLFAVIKMHGHEPIELMLEKMEYNSTRPDHLKENRKGLVGQKSY